MSHYQIVPECYADTLLVEILGFKRPNPYYWTFLKIA